MAGGKENVNLGFAEPESFGQTGENPGFFGSKNFVLQIGVTDGHVGKRTVFAQSVDNVVTVNLFGEMKKSIVGHLINSDSLGDVGLVDIKTDVHIYCFEDKTC